MYYNDNDKMEMIYIVAQDDEGNIIKTENKNTMIFFFILSTCKGIKCHLEILMWVKIHHI